MMVNASAGEDIESIMLGLGEGVLMLLYRHERS